MHLSVGGWNFGSKDDLGSDNSLFYTFNDVAGPQLAKNWKYDDGSCPESALFAVSCPIESDDILVHSLVQSGFYNITDVKPLKLIVTLNGKLREDMSFLKGIYIRRLYRGLNAEYENWRQNDGFNSIWYDKKVGRWSFGRYDDNLGYDNDDQAYDFGSYKTWIYSDDDVSCPQKATNWKYRQGRPIESDDILVNSLVESGMYINIIPYVHH